MPQPTPPHLEAFRGALPVTAAPPFGWCLPCIIGHKMAELMHEPPVRPRPAVTLVNGTASCYEHVGVELVASQPDNVAGVGGPIITSGDSPPHIHP